MASSCLASLTNNRPGACNGIDSGKKWHTQASKHCRQSSTATAQHQLASIVAVRNRSQHILTEQTQTTGHAMIVTKAASNITPDQESTQQRQVDMRLQPSASAQLQSQQLMRDGTGIRKQVTPLQCGELQRKASAGRLSSITQACIAQINHLGQHSSS